MDLRPQGVELRDLVFPSGAAPLHIASSCKRPAVAAALIRQLAEGGADLDAVWRLGNVADHDMIGRTPLQTAIFNSSADAAVAAILAL
jgi:ankyrin repeat protein